MNHYGYVAERHWARWLPSQYAAIDENLKGIRAIFAKFLKENRLIGKTPQGAGPLC